MADIPFIDLQKQRSRISGAIDTALARVLEHGRFILGPEVAEFETALARFTGAREVVSCASGTDALTLILMAEGIGPGDLVFVPAFTFVATAEAVAQLGATPYFVDVCEDTFNIDAESLQAAVDAAGGGAHGRPRAIIAVDLFGQPADYPSLQPIAEAAGLCLIADAAQSIGGSLPQGSAGMLGDYTATSFFPAKPLGCYGDGGAVFTDDGDKAEILRSLRMHGEGASKYDTVRIGLNSRLDSFQAAILLQKLSIFADELERRQQIADRYAGLLGDYCTTPVLGKDVSSSWAQYTIRSPHRDAIVSACDRHGIPTAIYYPKPMSRMGGYQAFPSVPGGSPVAEQLCREVVSLPMHPYLSEQVQTKIATAVIDAVAQAEKGNAA